MENQMNAVSLDATKENSIDAEPARPLTRLDEAAALLEQRQPEQTLEWAFNEFGASRRIAVIQARRFFKASLSGSSFLRRQQRSGSVDQSRGPKLMSCCSGERSV